MAQPRRPYYVSFRHDPIPTRVDHSRSSPGPSTGTADRAGYTIARLAGRGGLTFAWDVGGARADRQVPLFARSVNVYFYLTDFVVAISADYTEGSCAYNATRRHEYEAHLYQPIRIFHSYRDPMITRLNGIAMPTQDAPRWVLPQAVATTQNALEQQVLAEVLAVRQALATALHADRDLQDDRTHYRSVYRQCPAAEWSRRP